MMRFKGAAFAAVAVALMAIGCNSGGDTPASGSSSSPDSAPKTTGSADGGKTLTIAVIPKGSTHDYWRALHAGADEAEKELGIKIQFKGPLKEDAKEDQIKVVEDFTTAKVDGIVLAPLDNKALAKPVDAAVAAGIPVVIIDSSLDDTKFSATAMTNNYKGGQMAATELAKRLGDKGSVIMLRYEAGSASTMDREKGFMDEIAKHTGIKVVSSNQEGGSTVDSAQKKAEGLLGGFKNPDGSLQIQGIYCPNESTTAGMLLVLDQNHWAGKVKFVGFDSSPKLNEGLKAGKINGLVLQDPFKMGHDSVATMVKILKKQSFDKAEDTGATMVTTENMNEPANQKLLNPPQS
jgi:ribose transport system substrate-binding protein